MENVYPRPQNDAERVARLRLYRTRQIGPVTFRKLLLRYGSAGDAIEALPELARRGGMRTFHVHEKSRAEAELADLARIDGQAFHLGEPTYSKLLTAAEDAPPVIIARGNAELMSRPAIAVVGARNASANGRTIATGFAGDLSQAGYAVVSGMARGIDTAAHAGALAGGTIAVLAGGVDVVYPRENTDLYDRIVERGLVLSEMPAGTKPQGRHFPRRNRIISGLSIAVIVIEAAERSGSLTTARFALEQGREVLAVPGSPLDPRSHGTGRLIREGATLVMSSDHILEALHDPFRRPIESPASEAADQGQDAVIGIETADIHGPIVELLSHAPTSTDEIIRLVDGAPAAVRAALLELEVAGRIQCLSGNLVVLATG
jgi:DNA processing protein